MKALAVIALLLVCGGCATALDVLDAIAGPDDPAPVCDKDSVGTHWQGKQCMKMSDGSYQWTKENEP